MVKPF